MRVSRPTVAPQSSVSSSDDYQRREAEYRRAVNGFTWPWEQEKKKNHDESVPRFL